MKSIQEFKSKM